MCSDLSEVFVESLKLFGTTPEEFFDSDPDYPEPEPIVWPEYPLSEAAHIVLELLRATDNSLVISEGLNTFKNQSDLIKHHTNKLAYLSQTKDLQICYQLVELLGNFNDSESVDLLIAMSTDDMPSVRSVAVAALAKLPLQNLFRGTVKAALINALDDTDKTVVATAISGLVRILAPEVYVELIGLIEENQLMSEHFDAIAVYGPYKFKAELLELKQRLVQNNSYNSCSVWWQESLEELIRMSEMEFNFRESD